MRGIRAALLVTMLLGCSRKEPPGALARTAVSARTLSAVVAASAAARPAASAPSIPEAGPGTHPVQPSDRQAPGASDVAGGVLPEEERTWTFESPALGTIPVVVLLPERKRGERFPVLVTMHGRGEALKGPARGARGWIDDYWLPKAIARVRNPPLSKRDFSSFVSDERLERVNRALAAKPYRGLVIVCPYTPDALRGETFFEGAAPLAELFVRELLPRVYRETPALGAPASTGIDGVSLGGRAAYSVGLLRPGSFGVVAGVQAAFDLEEIPLLVPAAIAAKDKNPSIRFRILTSKKDYFREPDTAIARAFSDAGLKITFDVVEGPHDYDFNRGPGAIEMLVFHDRALRGEPLP